jgi:hypothetical protein
MVVYYTSMAASREKLRIVGAIIKQLLVRTVIMVEYRERALSLGRKENGTTHHYRFYFGFNVFDAY